MKSVLARRVQAWYVAIQPQLRNQALLVGVSGGADSLCLLHVLVALRERLGITLHVAHLNHQLRGAASDADAAFVAETARAWNVPITVAALDVQAYADSERLNLHQVARVTRYRWLAQQADAFAAGAVAVAHTADDQAETVLMHLLRGAGPAGLRGMQAVTDLRRMLGDSAESDVAQGCTLLRPLLTTTRAEIEQYCHDQGLQPRDDATNRDLQFTRNRIRHELLPQLATFNPQIVASLGRTAASAADTHDFVQQALDAAWPALVTAQPEAIAFDGAQWCGLHPALQREALRRAYRLLAGDDTLTVERIERAQQVIGRAGRRIELPGGLWLLTEAGGSFTVSRAGQAQSSMRGR